MSLSWLESDVKSGPILLTKADFLMLRLKYQLELIIWVSKAIISLVTYVSIYRRICFTKNSARVFLSKRFRRTVRVYSVIIQLLLIKKKRT